MFWYIYIYDRTLMKKKKGGELLACNKDLDNPNYGLLKKAGALQGLMDDIANYEEDDIANDEDVDEDLPGEVPNFNGEDVDYVDFLGIDNILNSSHDDYGEFYADEENYMFT